MERYEKYKDSRIEWIGKIPEWWEVKKLKYMANTTLGKMLTNSDKGNYEKRKYLRAANIEWLNVNISDVKEMWFSDDELKRLRLEEGDLLVSEGGEVGRTCIWKKELDECYIQNSVHKVTFNSQNNPEYFLNQFFVMGYKGAFDSIVNRISIGHLTGEKLKEICFIKPPLTEQIAIAKYLDRKTAEIDKLIAQKERLIELYEEEKTAIINQAVTKGIDPDVKLKDSGIEWMGEIPEGWEIKKLKYLGNIKYGLGQPPKHKIDGLPLIRATNIFRGRIDDKDMLFVDPNDIPYDRDPVLKENDIIVVRSGAYAADSAIIPKKYEGAITGYDMVFRTYNKWNPLFISYCLLSNYILNNQLLFHSLRAAQPHLNREELGETMILMPENKETQNTIVHHIETKPPASTPKSPKQKKS